MRGDLSAGDARLSAHGDCRAHDDRQPPCALPHSRSAWLASRDSYLLDQIRAVDKTRLVKRAGAITPSYPERRRWPLSPKSLQSSIYPTLAAKTRMRLGWGTHLFLSKKCLSEADLALREPGELDGGGGHGLLAGKVDGSLPVLVGEVAVDLEVLADALDHLEVDVVQGGAAGDRIGGMVPGMVGWLSRE